MFGSLISGGLSLFGARKAQKAQRRGFNEAITELRDKFDLSRADLSEGRESYDLAHNLLQDLFGGELSTEQMLERLPGYGFQREEMEKALERRAASQGIRHSPATTKEIMRHIQGLAGTSYNQNLANVFNLANLGGQSVGQGVQANQNFANSLANLYVGKGKSQAQGYSNMSNVVQGTLRNIETLSDYNKALGNIGGRRPTYFPALPGSAMTAVGY